jgi:hypothetical protein
VPQSVISLQNIIVLFALVNGYVSSMLLHIHNRIMSFLSIIFKVVLIRGVMNKATCELVRARLSKVFGSLAIIKWATRARK